MNVLCPLNVCCPSVANREQTFIALYFFRKVVNIYSTFGIYSDPLTFSFTINPWFILDRSKEALNEENVDYFRSCELSLC
jgi:hypothetical protein